MKLFGSRRPKFLDGKIWYPTFSFVKTFRNKKFSQKQWDLFTKIFRKVRQKNFDKKNVIPSFIYKLFRLLHFFWKLKGRPRPPIFSALIDKTILDGKIWYVPLFQPQKLFETRKFLKNSGIPLPKFLAMWDKYSLAENCDTLILHKIFWHPKVSETFKEGPRKISALWDRKFLTEIRDSLYYA